ncbi:MAG: DUF6345 domain-containing protein [Candidatus Aminicenantes bacterium]|nr:DUF6345 domain-containing protein [Candidatus Aminicenantes bacterium]
MKNRGIKLFTLLVLMAVIFYGVAIVNGQVRKIEKVNPQMIQKIRPVMMGPKIVINRVPLESPQGMKIFKVQTLQVQQDLIQKLSVKHLFNVTPVSSQPVMLRARMAPSRVQVYASKEKAFTKLLVNQDRGHIDLMPDLLKLEKVKVKLLSHTVAMNAAMKYIAEMKLIPQDVSQFAPKNVITLGMSTQGQGNTVAATPKLQSVAFQRSIEGRSVLGNGSQFTINLGDNGNVEGFQRKWNRLAPDSTRGNIAFRSNDEVYNRIEEILKQQFQGNVEIQVEKPQLVYFGDDGQFVQPAYVFKANIISNEGKGKAYYAGVVEAMQNPPELLFEAITDRILPETPTAQLTGMAVRKQSLPDPDDPTVGRYVVRQDSWDWVDDANDFKRGLQNGHCGGCPAITFPQFYWDEPRVFTTQDNAFADQCNIALMEGHGNHWLFTTRSNCCDVVFLNDGAQPGYGGHAGGQMAYLILKGCDIIPSPIELPNWPDPWWRIFKGLHQAIGFRTTMFINDNISYIFGYYLGRNCRILDSWFYATNSSASYHWQRSHGGEVTGFGAVVMIPGHEGDGIYYTAPAPDATSTGLTIWWQY